MKLSQVDFLRCFADARHIAWVFRNPCRLQTPPRSGARTLPKTRPQAGAFLAPFSEDSVKHAVKLRFCGLLCGSVREIDRVGSSLWSVVRKVP